MKSFAGVVVLNVLIHIAADSVTRRALAEELL
jgi:hypothetical protein